VTENYGNAENIFIGKLLTFFTLLLLVIAGGCAGESDSNHAVVADGLTAPRGLGINTNGNLLIAEAGGGRVLEVTGDGDVHTVASTLPHSLDAGPGSAYPSGPSAVASLNGEIHVIVGEYRGDRFARLYRVTKETAYEAVTPASDAFSAAENRFSNPYDMVLAPEVGGWIVSDSGRNALVTVNENGEIRDYFQFEKFSVPGREALVEIVPTGIARGPDGAVYVGSLTGFPYPRGMSTVWRVEDMNGDGDAMDEGEITPYATGFSTVTDITFDPQGRLYVAEFSSDMQSLVTGGQIKENAPNYPGRIIRIDGNERVAIIERAITPTGLLAHAGRLYYSEEFAGRVKQISLLEFS
jgi:hypothetical protein